MQGRLLPVGHVYWSHPESIIFRTQTYKATELAQSSLNPCWLKDHPMPGLLPISHLMTMNQSRNLWSRKKGSARWFTPRLLNMSLIDVFEMLGLGVGSTFPPMWACRDNCFAGLGGDFFESVNFQEKLRTSLKFLNRRIRKTKSRVSRPLEWIKFAQWDAAHAYANALVIVRASSTVIHRLIHVCNTIH